MMLSNHGYEAPNEVDSSNGKLLRDIEEISKALYVHNCMKKCPTPPAQRTARSRSVQKTHLPDAKSRSKNEGKWLHKRKMSSLWKWKPLKALSHAWQKKYTCCFFCHVHFIENLPSGFDGLGLIVNWKTKGNIIATSPSTVSDGTIEFEETLMTTCSVYATSGGHRNFVKYEAKPFLLFATISGELGSDVGRHWVDLTRFLPVTFEELEEDNCSGRWATSFKLAGKAKGATLHVSFGFVIMKDKLVELGCDINLPLILGLTQNGVAPRAYFNSLGDGRGDDTPQRVASVTSSLAEGSSSSSQSSDVKMLHEVLSDHGLEFSGSNDFGGSARFHFDFEQAKSLHPMPSVYLDGIKDFHGNESDDVEFTLIEKGVELEWGLEEPSKFKASAPMSMDSSATETIDVVEIVMAEKTPDEKIDSDDKHHHQGGSAVDALFAQPIYVNTPESDTEQVELEFLNMCISENLELKLSASVESHFLEGDIPNGVMLNHEAKDFVKSPRLDNLTESVANDFLDFLEQNFAGPDDHSDSGPESPAKRLLGQFEKDILASDSFDLVMEINEVGPEFSFLTPCAPSLESSIKGLNFSPAVKDGKEEDNGVQQSTRSKSNAKMLERLETHSLMQKRGLNEEAFWSPLCNSTGGFGSPILLSPRKPVPLPSLGDGIGSLLQLSNGGLLRSLSPALLRSAEGKVLIMQASSPAVLPAEMGSGILDILQCIASAGTERLSKQLNVLMPLEEVSGKVIQQLAEEASCKLPQVRLDLLQDGLYFELEDEGSPIVSSHKYFTSSLLDDGTGSRCISIKDLTPFALDAFEVLLIEGLRIQSGLSDKEASSSISLKTTHVSSFGAKVGNYVLSHELEEAGEHLIDLSISLNEWMRLDSGVFGDGDRIDERTLKILSAHHACSATDKNMNGASAKYGVMGNNVTITSMMLLRDPLRNYEPVGAPMLALLQVQRVSGHDHMSEDGSATEKSSQHEPLMEMDDDVIGKAFGEEGIPRFRLNEVHLAGFDLEFGDEKMWPTRRRRQSASRWLLASYMNKETRKLQFLKSNVIGRLTPHVARNSESKSLLWSISRDVRGIEGEWEELATQSALTRNPDIKFP
ncbi:hypothetical protein Dimus_020357 [Dionaea muscipula]